MWQCPAKTFSAEWWICQPHPTVREAHWITGCEMWWGQMVHKQLLTKKHYFVGIHRCIVSEKPQEMEYITKSVRAKKCHDTATAIWARYSGVLSMPLKKYVCAFWNDSNFLWSYELALFPPVGKSLDMMWSIERRKFMTLLDVHWKAELLFHVGKAEGFAHLWSSQ